MQLSQFESRIEGTIDLEIVENMKEGYLIRNNTTEVEYTALKGAILGNNEAVVFDILEGKREPRILRHVSRIVGYFSQIGNWNKSKLGELRARRAGNYAITG